MAGHLPIELDREHLKIIMQAIDLEIENQKPFERIKQKDDSFFQLLTKEYEMNEEHGKIDDLIFSYTPNTLEKSYEYHLDERGNVNQIYLVM
jgi:hypothetical protein|tara:strand:+ start:2804 stop:3079 length:276 start_codon:yes stop_codon:yes gene_type:complete